MKSIKELYRIGTGPSSSHTMAPRRAAEIFQHKHPNCTSFRVTLYGSLALTGRGHLTDVAILETLKPHGEVELVWEPSIFLPFHPNGLRFEALDGFGNSIDKWVVYSVGGGAIKIEGRKTQEDKDVYPLSTLMQIREYCEKRNMHLYDYVYACEGESMKDYLSLVWQKMKKAVERGVSKTGVLPGGLEVERRAKVLYENQAPEESA